MKMIFKSTKGKNLNKNLGKSQLYTAFTLAEVLITLGTIGIISAITIPTLVNNFQKNQATTALQKIYATTEVVFKMANSESPYSSWNWCTTGYQLNDGCPFKDNIMPKLKTIKSYNGYGFVDINGYPFYDFLHNSGGAGLLILENGTMMFFASPYIPYWQASIGFDINGYKKPNKPGIDIFEIKLICDNQMKCKLDPFYDETNCTFTPPGAPGQRYQRIATGCFAKIQKDGWKIKDDYPWQQLKKL